MFSHIYISQSGYEMIKVSLLEDTKAIAFIFACNLEW